MSESESVEQGFRLGEKFLAARAGTAVPAAALAANMIATVAMRRQVRPPLGKRGVPVAEA
ncbi:MAG: hypothetical protein ACREN1_04930 [Candidatus Dormibacteria bacterium]